jgi:hypothetical protein
MTICELGGKLSEMYENAPDGGRAGATGAVFGE